MARIEVGLHAHHAALAEAAQNNTPAPATASGSSTVVLEAPFAKVNSVVPGSPAESAGLQAGDSIVKFGTVDWTNHEKLSKVAEIVSQNEGVSFPLNLIAWIVLAYQSTDVEAMERQSFE